MDEQTPARSACAFCNRETALAVFGVVLGVLFIAMGVDVIRRNRASGEIESQVETGTAND